MIRRKRAEIGRSNSRYHWSGHGAKRIEYRSLLYTFVYRVVHLVSAENRELAIASQLE